MHETIPVFNKYRHKCQASTKGPESHRATPKDLDMAYGYNCAVRNHINLNTHTHKFIYRRFLSVSIRLLMVELSYLLVHSSTVPCPIILQFFSFPRVLFLFFLNAITSFISSNFQQKMFPTNHSKIDMLIIYNFSKYMLYNFSK